MSSYLHEVSSMEKAHTCAGSIDPYSSSSRVIGEIGHVLKLLLNSCSCVLIAKHNKEFLQITTNIINLQYHDS